MKKKKEKKGKITLKPKMPNCEFRRNEIKLKKPR
jgi:hypothetical protein